MQWRAENRAKFNKLLAVKLTLTSERATQADSDARQAEPGSLCRSHRMALSRSALRAVDPEGSTVVCAF